MVNAAKQTEMLELGALHCNAGAEEMRRAETAADFARAADWFKSALRLDPDNERAEAALEAALAAEQSLAAPPIICSPAANIRSDHFADGGSQAAMDADALIAQLERNQMLLGSVPDDSTSVMASTTGSLELSKLRDEMRCALPSHNWLADRTAAPTHRHSENNLFG